MDDEELAAVLEGYREDVTAVVRGAAPKRPWKCPDCPASMSYQHTYERHRAGHRLGRAPATRKLGQSSGSIRCGVEGCTAAYRSELEVDMHRQARHPRARFA